MSRYLAERVAGTWQVRDTVAGLVVDGYGPGSAGATAAATGAARLNKTNDSRPGNEVRAWRTAHGLSQARLAQLLGVQWLAVQRWEAGSRGVPPFLHLALKQLDQELPLTFRPAGTGTSG
jgi:DNA-binding transcriptional regulator YiaG